MLIFLWWCMIPWFVFFFYFRVTFDRTGFRVLRVQTLVVGETEPVSVVLVISQHTAHYLTLSEFWKSCVIVACANLQADVFISAWAQQVTLSFEAIHL